MFETKAINHGFESALMQEIASLPYRIVKKGEIIVWQHFQIEAIPFVLKGVLKVTKTDFDSSEITIRQYTDGQIVLHNIVDSQKARLSGVSVVANCDAQVLLISPALSQKWILKYMSWRRYIRNSFNTNLDHFVFNEFVSNIKINNDKDHFRSSNTYPSNSESLTGDIPIGYERIQQDIINNFLMFKPSTGESVDFNWMEHYDGKIYIALCQTATCLNRPKLVSSICSEAFNQTISTYRFKEVDKILEKTSQLAARKFSCSEYKSYKFIDIALFCIDSENQKIWFRATNRPLYRIKRNRNNKKNHVSSLFVEYNNNLVSNELKRESNPFTTLEINYEPGDNIYIFNEGADKKYEGFKSSWPENTALNSRQSQPGSEIDMDRNRLN